MLNIFTALVDVPAMGRRKFSFEGKPHGRNELITIYLWIAYKKSLPAGESEDPTKMRTRKQVSSHIQVLKGFMRTHRDCTLSTKLSRFLDADIK